MNKTNNHHLTTERLIDFLDGTLSSEESQFVRIHIQSCGKCRAEIEFQRSLAKAARSMPLESPSPRFVSGTLHRIAAKRREARIYAMFRSLGVILPMIILLAGAFYVFSTVSPEEFGSATSRASEESTALTGQYREYVEVLRQGIDAVDVSIVREAFRHVPFTIVLVLAALFLLMVFDRLFLVRFSRMKS